MPGLPTDARLPLDNDYANQEPSKALIQDAKLLANDIVGRLLSDSARLAKVVGCTPTGPNDAACFEHFVTRFGRLAFRRTLDPEEVTRFLGPLELSKRRGSGTVAVDPIVSPRLAFETLFKGLAPQTNNTGEAEYLLKRRKSVIDLVQASRQRLISKLGAQDKRRMERHFDELRSLELRVEELEAAGPAVGACVPPSNPGDDPPIGKLTSVGCTFDEKSGSCYDSSTGYSDEELRGDLLSDFIATAFACDLTRVVSYQLSFWKCYMNAYAATGYTSDFHSLSHQHIFPHGAFADGVGFHVKLFAQVVSKLGKLKEIDGSNMLDHCAMSLVFEGGRGLDPQTGKKHSTHSSENMVMLVAGRAGGLKSGQHIVAQDARPAQVVASTMHAVGVKQDLGEVKGTLPALFG